MFISNSLSFTFSHLSHSNQVPRPYGYNSKSENSSDDGWQDSDYDAAKWDLATKDGWSSFPVAKIQNSPGYLWGFPKSLEVIAEVAVAVIVGVVELGGKDNGADGNDRCWYW